MVCRMSGKSNVGTLLGRSNFFEDSSPCDFPENLEQNLLGVAISGHSERISPGQNGSEVEPKLA